MKASTDSLNPVTAEEHNLIIRFAGHCFIPLLSGALFFPDESTLLVADLHFEKMSSFARTGQLLPPYDTGVTLSRLERDLRATGASRLICLGDSFHRDEGTNTLLPEDKKRLSTVIGGRECIWLAGNHDPAPHDLGGICREELELGGLVFSHEPTRHRQNQIAGHLHPAARVKINGRSVRRPCFVNDRRLMILPAYGASTGSLNILSEAFDGLFSLQDLHVTMIGKTRLYPVATKRLVKG
jgi:uncharacterized protein